MRMTKLATVISFVLIGAAAQAGDYKMTKEQFTAADTDRDGSLTLAEAQASAPKFAEKFAKVDANGDGKVSVDELNAHGKSGDKSMESDEATTPPTDK
jgi:Ca2+-binding EF-hand superfamily protein